MAKKTRYVCVDIEADGPIPGRYSMIQLGACFVDDENATFLRNLQPISSDWVPEALAVSGKSRADCYNAMPAIQVMEEFRKWLTDNAKNDRIVFVADNAGFDWMFVCWYFHSFLETNPFGYTSISITSLYKGFAKTMEASFKHLRTEKHTHNALDDAKGNAGAFRQILRKMEEGSEYP